MSNVRDIKQQGTLIDRLKRAVKGGLQDHPEDSEEVRAAKRQGLGSKQLRVNIVIA